MKLAVILLTTFAAIGLIMGIVLVEAGKIAFTGVVLAVTIVLTCIARRIEKYRKQIDTEQT